MNGAEEYGKYRQPDENFDVEVFACPSCGEESMDNIYVKSPSPAVQTYDIINSMCACITCGFIAYGSSNEDAMRRFSEGDESYPIYMTPEQMRAKQSE